MCVHGTHNIIIHMILLRRILCEGKMYKYIIIIIYTVVVAGTQYYNVITNVEAEKKILLTDTQFPECIHHRACVVAVSESAAED